MSLKAEVVQFLLSQARNAAGSLAGGTATFYTAGTETLKTIWLDRNKATTADNPHDLDANGTAHIYADGLYKIVLKNSSGNTIYTRDNINFSDPITSGIDLNVADYASLAAAVASIGSTEATLVVSTAQSLADSLTIPSTLTLDIRIAGLITIASSKVLTFERQPSIGMYQAFAGSGTVAGLNESRPEWFGAVGDDSNDDGDAVMEAIAAVDGGIVNLTQTYKVSEPIPVANPMTITGGGTIHQITVDATAFNVTNDNVIFDGITITGTSSETGDTDTSATLYTGIFADGSNGANITGLTVRNCTISGFDHAIGCEFNTNLLVENNYIHTVFVGVFGGTGNASTYQDDTSLSGKIVNNVIHCSYGPLAYSRPIRFQYNGGGLLVHGNELRGGGMAFENLGSLPVANDKRVIITNNDCDTAISGGDIISGNVLDTSHAPVGRGPQADFFQAIEPFPYANVIGNTVRNFVNGVASLMAGVTIIGNKFYNCGEGVGNGGVITVATNGLVDRDENIIISHNSFFDTTGETAAIRVNGDSVALLVNNVKIESNLVYNSEYIGIVALYGNGYTIRNNTFIDVYSTSSGTAGTEAAIYCGNISGVIEGNEIVNTLGATGVYYGIVVSGTVTYGFNKSTGQRNTIYFSKPRLYSAPNYMEDDVLVSYIPDAGGSPVGSLTPSFIGEISRDNVGDDFYIASGLTNADWLKITP